MLTEFSHKIIFPDGRDRLVTRRRRAVYASGKDVHMRCGGCGATDFTVHVRPGEMGAAKVTNVICSVCGKVFPLNDRSELGGTLNAETADSRKREEINERIDN